MALVDIPGPDPDLPPAVYLEVSRIWQAIEQLARDRTLVSVGGPASGLPWSASIPPFSYVLESWTPALAYTALTFQQNASSTKLICNAYYDHPNGTYRRVLSGNATMLSVGLDQMGFYRMSSGAGGTADVLQPFFVCYPEQAQVEFPKAATAPVALSEGVVYFDTTSKKLRCWDGTAWQNLF
jgi:hypothetical protein